nr:Uncharacterised protein [Raoultella sp. NCTC 9187]
MAGEDRGIDQDVPLDPLDAGLFERGHHIANILPPERRIAAKTGNQVTFQHATVEGTFGFQGGGETEVWPQLEQGSQRGDHLLSTGR